MKSIIELEENPDNAKSVGFFGENIAGRFLKERGYKILARNYQKPWGEIDIIAEKEGIIIFCEVKTNRQKFQNGGFDPELRVNPVKFRHIVRTAEWFMKSRYAEENREWRVDVIAVILDRPGQKAHIKHFKNAISD